MIPSPLICTMIKQVFDFLKFSYFFKTRNTKADLNILSNDEMIHDSFFYGFAFWIRFTTFARRLHSLRIFFSCTYIVFAGWIAFDSKAYQPQQWSC